MSVLYKCVKFLQLKQLKAYKRGCTDGFKSVVQRIKVIEFMTNILIFHKKYTKTLQIVTNMLVYGRLMLQKYYKGNKEQDASFSLLLLDSL
jgi:hypothetical protein